MTEITPLSTILSDEPQVEVDTEAAIAHAERLEAEETERPEASEAPAETAERPRGPDGKFVKKGEDEAPPASQQVEDQGHIPIAALKDERSKRQALENELAQLRQQMQAPQPQQEQAPPDRWEDPEGYDRWLMGQVTDAAEQRAIEAFNHQRIATAAQQFMAEKPDYQEAIQVFGQMANVNPGLVQQMQAAPNPAQYAYETAKLQMEIQQHGGLEGLIEARLKARQSEALQTVQSQLPTSLPPSISSDRSVGQRSGPQWSGPTPLSDILG